MGSLKPDTSNYYLDELENNETLVIALLAIISSG